MRFVAELPKELALFLPGDCRTDSVRNKAIISALMRILVASDPGFCPARAVLAANVAMSAQSIAPPAPVAQPAASQRSGARRPKRLLDGSQLNPNDAGMKRPRRDYQDQVREVNVIFTVTDKHGRFKKDLKQDDLQIPRRWKSAGADPRPSALETDLPVASRAAGRASNSIRDTASNSNRSSYRVS